LADYAGQYEEPAYGTATVRLDKGELVLEWSSFRVRLEHYQDDAFRVHDQELGRNLLEFHIADGKRVAAMTAIGVRFAKK
jgi:hypothetical protein